jgi:hypothetical protein
MPQDWVVRDDARELHFTGVKLADVSSRSGTKRRWIELRLYRTTGGNYVVERVGRSVIKGEVQFYFAQVCETAAAVVETLYAKDDEGAWFLSGVSRDVLEEAGEADRELRRAYMTEHVD